jgi:hypothetical protein
MMYDLANFTESDASACGNALVSLGSRASSMEEVANGIVQHLYDNLTDKRTGKRSCALVRFYKTQPYGQLDPELRGFAQGLLGEKAEWNSRAKSVGHKAIPLPSEKFVSQIPMISRLVSQFGLDVHAVIKPDPSLLADLEQKSYNAFHVPEAVGSPYIPAQKEFVIPFGVQSVLGFGGMLGSGDLFALILFAKVHIPRKTADLANSLALKVKEAVQPFAEGKIFA